MFLNSMYIIILELVVQFNKVNKIIFNAYIHLNFL